MRPYELTMIFAPTPEEKKREETIDEVRRLIEASKGTVQKVDIWGRRALAFPIQKHDAGIYIAMDVVLDATCVQDLRKSLSNHTGVLRSLIVAGSAKEETVKPKRTKKKMLKEF